MDCQFDKEHSALWNKFLGAYKENKTIFRCSKRLWCIKTTIQLQMKFADFLDIFNKSNDFAEDTHDMKMCLNLLCTFSLVLFRLF